MARMTKGSRPTSLALGAQLSRPCAEIAAPRGPSTSLHTASSPALSRTDAEYVSPCRARRFGVDAMARGTFSATTSTVNV
ncbi:MAG: hypothetical protein HYV07_24980 [Deltaproteobacteria bacterium]|nr:hypothetical protein [Deltaproteobacteria bacterium]